MSPWTNCLVLLDPCHFLFLLLLGSILTSKRFPAEGCGDRGALCLRMSWDCSPGFQDTCSQPVKPIRAVRDENKSCSYTIWTRVHWQHSMEEGYLVSKVLRWSRLRILLWWHIDRSFGRRPLLLGSRYPMRDSEMRHIQISLKLPLSNETSIFYAWGVRVTPSWW